jgi:hypothetical protein
MKTFLKIKLIILLFFSLLISQEHDPIQHHDDIAQQSTNFHYMAKKIGHYSAEDWAAVIDTTWGLGTSTEEKLEIFDDVYDIIDDEFAAFQGLPGNILDSLRQRYRPEIETGVSHGRFVAIMNHFLLALKESHAWIVNEEVNWYTPLQPGVPLFVINGWPDNSHFGATLTPLPDSSLLVIKTLPTNPLDLVPGDIIIGYDGIPWKDLYPDLLKYELPLFYSFIHRTTESAFTHDILKNAGMNWHLFDTLDVVKYSTNDTMHYPTALLAGQSGNIAGNEQLKIPGVPFPDINWEGVFGFSVYYQENYVSWGIIDGTNIGYIYVYSWVEPDQGPGSNVREEFYQAVDTLMNHFQVEGLIHDSRFDLGWGMYNTYDPGLSLIFNSYIETIAYDERCNANDHFQMCPSLSWTASRLAIPGDPRTIFDRPIAVLTGPGAISGGDVYPLLMTYHPMSRLFGKPTAGAFSSAYFYNPERDFHPGWQMSNAKSNAYFVNDPGTYLSRSESHVDEEIWLTQEDVAKREDTVVKRAIEWIQNLSYAHDVTVDKLYVNPGTDSVKITAWVENPNEHQLSLMARIKSMNDTFIDSLNLYDDGMHGDRSADDNLWGNIYFPPGGSYLVSVTTNDLTDETSCILPNVAWFTTIGPLNYAGMTPFLLPISLVPGGINSIKLHLVNIGKETIAENIEARLISNTPKITIHERYSTFSNIPAGDTVESSQGYSFQISEDIHMDTTIYLTLDIFSEGYKFWKDSIVLPIITAIDQTSLKIPTIYSLEQNYPNPFNPITIINYQLPMINDVELSIYNILGQKVATLVSERKQAGYHQIEWNASGFASGIYYYRIEAGEFHDVKKMVLLK